ncbi:MAG TPA: bifunctional (p)ppGpp synthetase/guanosine-3',5'-bis(diphosphate) 3'-pyrophosphohydrolase [Acidobacteriaceae bacterium]|jgi:guanosine-3',5'-bis(diphosphate) 3'-pyrophosphohydrolase|nr:bifunctional (p)ppGpp synthetase/guanosine-3',5'-bis(diphosphate) 3'-pyrophosphohydrolase [Acidobacteriaceae bacterium]
MASVQPPTLPVERVPDPGSPKDKSAVVVDLFPEKFAQLLDTIRRNRPSDDTNIIRQAWQFCLEHHNGQLRASGEPYVLHPLEVALVLAEMKLDSTAIAAGLLHDAVEDTPVTTEDIVAKFGEQVAHIVEGVTKIDKIQFANREDRQAENVRKMLLAMVSDVRVVLIKLADRLHNMRTLEHLSLDRQRSIARETLDIYAPLAHRLGMGKLRGELEDLAFRYVDTITWDQLHEAVEARRSEGEQFLSGVEALLSEKLHENNIKARVEWRIKRLYSIHQKLVKSETSIDQVYDLLALRVITSSVQDCYAVFGIIHSIWRPVPGRIKDFIAMPRPNLYQSLHTTVMGEGGHQFEVQIRTEEMHRIAEEGIAAHWKYKQGGSPVSARDEQRLAWVRQLVEWQRDMTDPNEFLSTLKIDLFPEEVYTFTPKGKVVVVPRDGTPLDFAYTIHTEVGHTCIGARVNGRMVPLRTKLRNGDIVEVITQNGHTPSRDWLTFVKSSRARNKIRHWINEHQRERAIDIGRKLLEREARKYKIPLSQFEESDYARLAADYSVATPSDLMAAIGFGKYSARQVLNRLAPGLIHPLAEPEAAPLAPGAEAVRRVSASSGSDSLVVEGQNELLVYRARCCNPIRGEEIIGYVTRGKGVAVHARNCPNVQNLLYEADRRIAVEWAKTPEEKAGRPQTYPVKLTVHCDDRAGMLKEITATISDANANIRTVETHPGDAGDATIEFVIDAEDVRHLTLLIQGLRRLPGVRDVQRSQKL